MFVDNNNLWEGLCKDDDITSILEKVHQGVNSWERNLLAVGGELRLKTCSYIVHRMKPTIARN